MTFDNGASIGSGSVTEQAIRLIVQAIITLAVIGAWFYMLTVQNPAADMIGPIVMTLIAAWFGQGIVGTIAGYKKDQALAQVEHAKALQLAAAAQPIEQPGFTGRMAKRITGGGI